MKAPPDQSWRQLPAWRALVIQCGAATAVLTVFLLARSAALHPPIPFYLILQGAIAAIASHRNRLPHWWLYIQFCFPVALWVVQSWQLPPGFFLAGFLFLLVLYWGTYRTRVPYYPSRRAAWDEVSRLLPAGQPLKLLDAGSGTGGLIIHLAARHPHGSFTGIEAAPLPWLVSRVRAWAGSGHRRFLFGRYECLDFAAYDVVFAYLSPAAMPAFWQKARSEMRRGSLLLSYEFEVPEVEPHLRLMPQEGGPILYGWHM